MMPWLWIATTSDDKTVCFCSVHRGLLVLLVLPVSQDLQDPRFVQFTLSQTAISISVADLLL